MEDYPVNENDVTPIYPTLPEIHLTKKNKATENSDQATKRETVSVKVVRPGTEAIKFVLNMSSKMKKLMEIYSQEAGFGLNGLRFLFDGHRIQDTDTPKSLELENDDVIDVAQIQYGGHCNNSSVFE